MSGHGSQQVGDTQSRISGGSSNPIEENITVLACSVFPEECFAEDEVAARLAIRNDVQYELVRPGNAMAVIRFSGLGAINPMYVDSCIPKQTASLCFGPSDERGRQLDAVVH